MAEGGVQESAHWSGEDTGRLRRGLDLAVRGSALPVMLGLRLAGWVGQPRGDALPAAQRSFALASKIALDEFFFCTEMASATTISFADRDRLGSELTRSLGMYQQEGWLEDPASYHEVPPPLEGARLRDTVTPWGRFRRLQFESGYEPHRGEPGRARWLSYARNKTAHAWLFEHRGRSRPWVVCVPGYRMGHPLVDITGFRVHWMHQRLGLNVAIPVMPLHGPRRIGKRTGDGFLRGDFVDTVHAQAQAVWDIRRLVHWLQRECAPAVGAHGVSLGGYTVALLASLEPKLECVIAGIPATSFVRLLRGHAPAPALALLERLGVDFDRLEQLLRPVSPLAIPPAVPRERRFIYAGIADRLVTADQAHDLWLHWGKPPIAWYEGSHVSFLFEEKVKRMVEDALAASGMIHAPGRRLRGPRKA